uniref:Uncharacterized protein n=1 Tax=Aegilops tauschii TaxID=37682 RepID=M8CRR0_AEGTA
MAPTRRRPAAAALGVWPAQPGAPLTSKRRASASRALLLGSSLARPPASPQSVALASPTPSALRSTALRFADQAPAAIVAAYNSIDLRLVR